MLYDVEQTEELCPKCGTKMECHTTSGPMGQLRARLWCPKRDYAGPWELSPGSYVPGMIKKA